jgi:hypothetical protein
VGERQHQESIGNAVSSPSMKNFCRLKLGMDLNVFGNVAVANGSVTEKEE